MSEITLESVCALPECGRPLWMHQPHTGACQITSRSFPFSEWHPSNRFTPAVREEARPLLCVICKQSLSLHSKDEIDLGHCPVRNSKGEIVGYDTRFQFTTIPRPTVKEALRAGGEKVWSVPDKQGIVTPSTCPPNALPFDLAKALAGAEMVTRSGRAASNLKYCPYGDREKECLIATVDGKEVHYKLSGKRWSATDDHPLDLFLAAKEEECDQCRGNGFVMMPNAEAEPCDKCQPEAYKEFCKRKIRGIVKYPTPPETEARRAEESEKIERQIEVMRAFYSGAEMEVRHRNFSGDDEWVKVVKPPSEFRFNWQDFNHRIRPASPAPPRRVWLSFDAGPEPVVVKPSQSLLKAVEYINLNQLLAIAPEVRAKLGMGGEEV